MAAAIEAQLVDREQAPQAGVRTRVAAEVRDRGRRRERGGEAALAGPERVLGVLGVEEEGLVPVPAGGQALPWRSSARRPTPSRRSWALGRRRGRGSSRPSRAGRRGEGRTGPPPARGRPRAHGAARAQVRRRRRRSAGRRSPRGLSRPASEANRSPRPVPGERRMSGLRSRASLGAEIGKPAVDRGGEAQVLSHSITLTPGRARGRRATVRSEEPLSTSCTCHSIPPSPPPASRAGRQDQLAVEGDDDHPYRSPVYGLSSPRPAADRRSVTWSCPAPARGGAALRKQLAQSRARRAGGSRSPRAAPRRGRGAHRDNRARNAGPGRSASRAAGTETRDEKVGFDREVAVRRLDERTSSRRAGSPPPSAAGRPGREVLDHRVREHDVELVGRRTAISRASPITASSAAPRRRRGVEVEQRELESARSRPAHLAPVVLLPPTSRIRTGRGSGSSRDSKKGIAAFETGWRASRAVGCRRDGRGASRGRRESGDGGRLPTT